MSLMLPFEPVSLVGSSTGRPVARSTDGPVDATKGSADQQLTGGRSSVYAKPFLSNAPGPCGVAVSSSSGEDSSSPRVVVPVVVRRELVRPQSVAICRPPREDAGGPLVVTARCSGL